MSVERISGALRGLKFDFLHQEETSAKIAKVAFGVLAAVVAAWGIYTVVTRYFSKTPPKEETSSSSESSEGKISITSAALENVQNTLVGARVTNVTRCFSKTPPKEETSSSSESSGGKSSIISAALESVQNTLVGARVTKKCVCIASQVSAGYVGFPEQWRIMPEELKEIIMDNGEPLPLNPCDCLVDFYLFDNWGEARKSAKRLVLPSALFEGKKEGNSVRFNYAGEQFELTINQNDYPLTDRSFEEELAFTKVYVEEFCDIEQPMYGKYDRYWWYTVGDHGALYKLEQEGEAFALKEKDKEEFRPKRNPSYVGLSGGVVNGKFQLKATFVGLSSDNVDVIVNKHCLIFYGRVSEEESLRIIEEEERDCTVRYSSGDIPISREEFFRYREVITAYRWDRSDFFKDLALEEMKELIQASGKLSLQSGILRFQFDLPLKTP